MSRLIPDMLDRAPWEQSGHWEKLAENMYITGRPTSASIAVSR
jgi:threonyl-tRNA synthetase